MRTAFIFSVLLVSFILGIPVQSQNNSSVKMELSETEDKDFSEPRHMIKLNPLLFLRGDIPIYYERNISDKISVEAGIGLTLTDYWHNAYTTFAYSYEESNEMGYSFRIGLRYYASNYNYLQEGFYFGLNYRYQQYKSSFVSIENTPFAGSNDFSNSDIRLHIGYLHLWEENFFIEPYIAFGVRQKKYNKIVETPGLTYTTVSSNEMKPILTLAVKFGISL